MADLFLPANSKTILVGDTQLTGFEELEINQEALFDEKKVPGKSGVERTPNGYADDTFTLKFILLNDTNATAINKLRLIARLFRATDEQENPILYGVHNPVLEALSIRKAYIKKITTRVSSGLSNGIRVDVEFIEDEKPAALKEQQVIEQKTKEAAPPIDFLSKLNGT